ncbi:hypothetical protein B0H16DRAFT_1551635 [Mycena metata]|uniref:Uncharacterized protein n=1 Tax=Mycena metata TaxID=1033252 RepID=A0AAD7IRQ1_9AGAR|nr:hypothetical protein B0H16DRAFT_1551635 [Mycena metata]
MIRAMRLAFRGDLSMAYAVARLNMPALELIIIVLQSPIDVNGLYLCGALLTSIRYIVFAGVCPAVLTLFRIFSLMRA